MISRLRATLPAPFSGRVLPAELHRKLSLQLIEVLPRDTAGLLMVEVNGVYDYGVLNELQLDPVAIVPIARIVCEDSSASKVYEQAYAALQEVLDHCAYGLALSELRARFWRKAIITGAAPGTAEHLLLDAIASKVRDTCAENLVGIKPMVRLPFFCCELPGGCGIVDESAFMLVSQNVAKDIVDQWRELKIGETFHHPDLGPCSLLRLEVQEGFGGSASRLTVFAKKAGSTP